MSKYITQIFGNSCLHACFFFVWSLITDIYLSSSFCHLSVASVRILDICINFITSSSSEMHWECMLPLSFLFFLLSCFYSCIYVFHCYYLKAFWHLVCTLSKRSYCALLRNHRSWHVIVVNKITGWWDLHYFSIWQSKEQTNIKC